MKDYNENRESIDIKLLNWFIASSILPIAVSNSFFGDSHCSQDEKSLNINMVEYFLNMVKPDGVVISGGNNFGEYPNRDQIEFFLLDWAKENKKPVLGICRGMQVMAKWAGVKLIKVKNHVNTRHQIYCSSNDEFFPKIVNSFHNWGIESCPKDFFITAKAKDGVIEAIKHKNLPWEGWMWHPEREEKFTSIDTDRMVNLFNDL